MIKQVIVMRKDLNMRKGKMIAQGAHASMKAIIDRGFFYNETITEARFFSLYLNFAFQEWLEGKFTKICVSVDSYEQLMEVYNQAKDSDLPCALITDIGATEFHGIPTETCCAIGPAEECLIDKITGNLKLL
jgi:PTH2 family peptidyl-tRNA hydrolase